MRPVFMLLLGAGAESLLGAGAERVVDQPRAPAIRGVASGRREPLFIPASAPSCCNQWSLHVREDASRHVSSASRRVKRLLHNDAARHLLAGAAAGVVSNTIVAPLDIMRLNLMVSAQQKSWGGVAREIFAEGGVRAFWRGNTADVIRTIPSSAVRFYSFAVYKENLADVPALAPALVSLLAGGFAGMTAMALLFPLETVRTQMAMSGGVNGVTIMAFSRNLVATKGVGGLYQGLSTSLVSVMPYFGVRFGVYDALKRWHVRIADGQPIPSQFNAAYGFAAGFAASALTFPMEVVRRRAMVGVASTNMLVAVPAILRAEGLKGLYKGYSLNVIKVAPSSAITFFVYEMVRDRLDRIADAPAPKPAPLPVPLPAVDADVIS